MKRPCLHPGCPELVDRGYCDTHRKAIPRKPDKRGAAYTRGYGREWQKIRMEVLQEAGIPQHEWIRYDVDHVPRYDPETEPDHRAYALIPMLRADHSRKTVKHDGGFGNTRR